MSISNKLELSVNVILRYLKEQIVPYQITTSSYEKNLIKIKIQPTTNVGYKVLNIVAVELDIDRKCMISILADDLTLGNGIFDYSDDFKITDDYKYPLDEQDIKIQYQTIYPIIDKKLNLHARLHIDDAQRYKMNSDNPSKDPLIYPNAGSNLSGNIRSEPIIKRPDDMPSFEDEYEINDTRRGQYSSERLPGMAVDPNRTPGYGDRDLYPGGQKFPNLSNPLGGILGDPTQPGGHGGMIFDPNLNSRNNTRNRGPGYIPGSKYDDPFGNPSNLGNNFGSGFGGGFGGGFI